MRDNRAGSEQVGESGVNHLLFPQLELEAEGGSLSRFVIGIFQSRMSV